MSPSPRRPRPGARRPRGRRACAALPAASGLLLLASALACQPPAGADPTPPAAAPPPGKAAQRVRVARVEAGRIEQGAVVAGLTEAFRHATVSAELGARVVERHAEPGARVAQGDPLVSLDTAELAIAIDEAAATLAARSVDLAQAQRELARGDELASEGAISEGRHDSLRFARDRAKSARDLAEAALRRARQQRADAVVRAPFDGTVEEILVHVGDYTNPGAAVATLVDFARVRLRAGLTASEAARIEPGQRAEVTIAALGGYRRDAVVHSVGMRADHSGTYPMELWLDNPEGTIRGGMVADVRLLSPRGEEVPLAPRAAVLRRAGQLAVFVVEGPESGLHARLRPVRVGRQHGDEVELMEGVRAGERVVIEGLFALTDGAAVQIDGAVVARSGGSWSD